MIKDTGPDDPLPDERLHAEFHLNYHASSGWVGIRDSASYRSIKAMLAMLAFFGWHANGDDETVEPYEFDDGEVGVKVWLYRLEPMTVATGLRAIGKAA